MRALVTGGGGFLGSAIVRRLLAEGYRVRSLARGDYPNLREIGVETLRGSLEDAQTVCQAVDGCDTVFHVAALAGVWGPYKAYWRANVLGTRHVIDACRRHGCRRLVFTSSPSVTFTGVDQEGVDERAPYPRRFLAHYPRTKAEAERLALGANSPELATVALRPHLIWGPGDNHLVPRLIARARAGRLRLVGGGLKRVDSVFIDNAAQAHLLAAGALGEGPQSRAAGKAYFISNGEPIAMADLINRILAAAGLAPATRSISPAAAYAVGAAMEIAFGALRLRREPPLTRFVARQLATAHWFDIGAARRDFGYRPEVSLEEGMRRLGESLASAIS